MKPSATRILGADKPFLDVWFADENNGYAVGAYNLIFRTADGGKNWEPWFDRTENPKLFNLYAIRPAAGGLYIAGEGGLVLKLDPDAQRFRALPVPYKGSFFGVTGGKSRVLVFGLRGNAFRSDDSGRTWVKADVGLPASIVGGTTTAGGDNFLADQGGRVVVSEDGGSRSNRSAQESHAAGRHRRRRQRPPGAGRATRRRRRRTGDALTNVPRRLAHRNRPWLPSPTISTRCPWSAGSRTSTGNRGTSSNASSSTTGWRW